MGEKLTLHKDSNLERSFTVNSTPIHDGKENVRGVIITFDDLTELEKKNEALKETLSSLGGRPTALALRFGGCRVERVNEICGRYLPAVATHSRSPATRQQIGLPRGRQMANICISPATVPGP